MKVFYEFWSGSPEQDRFLVQRLRALFTTHCCGGVQTERPPGLRPGRARANHGRPSLPSSAMPW